jgi:hypothetical protein
MPQKTVATPMRTFSGSVNEPHVDAFWGTLPVSMGAFSWHDQRATANAPVTTVAMRPKTVMPTKMRAGTATAVDGEPAA